MLGPCSAAPCSHACLLVLVCVGGCLHVYAHLFVPVDVPAHVNIELRCDARGTRVGSRSSAGGYKRCVLGRLALAQSRMIAVTL